MTTRHRAATVVFACLTPILAASLPAFGQPVPHLPRCLGTWRGDAGTEGGGTFLPAHDVFSPLLADIKEPRLSLTFRQVRFEEQALPSGGHQYVIDSGAVSAGGVFGLWGTRRADGCGGVQVSLLGGVFSQFNLDTPSRDLMNSDFVVGLQITARRGRWSARARLYHQSSHLGDEFILRNPGVLREDFGFQGADGLVSIEGRWWRVYGGGGYLHFTVVNDGPVVAQGGVELRSTGDHPRRLRPVGGLDVVSLQARDWGATRSVAVGLEWEDTSGVRRMRVLAVLLDGFTPFGQYSNRQRVQAIGLQWQLEF